MEFIGLNEEQVDYIVKSVSTNPVEWASTGERGLTINHKEELRSWLLEQVKAQKESNHWRKDLRERGRVA